MIGDEDKSIKQKNNEVRKSIGLSFNLPLYSFLTVCFCLFLNNISLANVDKGEWFTLEQEMSKPRTNVTCRLLPDGNVFIMGSTNYAEIFNTKEQKIIKKIPIDYLRYENYNSVSLQNGDVYIVGGERQQNSIYLKPVATIFNGKTYKFEEVVFPSYNFLYDNLILLNNGHILMVQRTMGLSDTHQIYNPDKDIYYTANNNNIIPAGRFLFKFKNGDILFHYINDIAYIYNYTNNKFEKTSEVPLEHISVQIDEENYLNIKPMDSYSEGYIYNVKTKIKTPIKNKINKTWYVNNPYRPQTVLLDNGNVLIMGIFAKGKNNIARFFYKYSSYIYDRNNNKFYKINNPQIPIFKGTGIIKLENGDILFVGGPDEAGKKIQIYKYKH